MIRRLRAQIQADQRGESPVSLLLIAPMIMLILGVIIAAGRIGEATTAVESAVAAAAREATVAIDPVAAQSNAQSTVSQMLTARGIHCPGFTLSLDASALHNAPGVQGAVLAQVQCQVRLADLMVPGLPGSVNITRDASSPVDSFRGR